MDFPSDFDSSSVQHIRSADPMSAIGSTGTQGFGGPLQYSVAMASKANEITKQQGRAIVEMIDAAASPAANAPNAAQPNPPNATTGTLLNVTA